MGNIKSQKREELFFEAGSLEEFEELSVLVGENVLKEFKGIADSIDGSMETSDKFLTHQMPKKKKPLLKEIRRYKKMLDVILNLEPGQVKEKMKLLGAPTQILNFQRYLSVMNPKTNKVAVYEMLTKILKEFAEEEPSLEGDDFHQCTRTLMGMFGCGCIYNQKKKMTDLSVNSAMKGFVLLYPYVDNFLDDATMTRKEKKNVMVKFRELLLTGKRFECETELDRNLMNSVIRVEKQWSREKNPILYWSMVKLLDYQVESMKQIIGGKKPKKSKNEEKVPKKKKKIELVDRSDEIPEYLTLDFVERISMMKAYHSVISSCYAVNNQWSPDWLEFLAYLGIILQFVDDLQDVEDDFEKNQMTIFTYALKKGEHLDKVVCRFFNWMVKGDEKVGNWLDRSFPYSFKYVELSKKELKKRQKEEKVVLKQENEENEGEDDGDSDSDDDDSKKQEIEAQMRKEGFKVEEGMEYKKVKIKLGKREKFIRGVYRGMLVMFCLFSIGRIPKEYFSEQFFEKEFSKLTFLPVEYFVKLCGKENGFEIERFLFLDIVQSEEKGKLEMQKLFDKSIEILKEIDF